jgi:ABC-type Fe3+/spermidine/putrescine transport system ATPase subunit
LRDNAPVDGRYRERLSGFVRELVFIGTDTRYAVQLPTNEIVFVRVQNAGGGNGAFMVGETVQIGWSADDVRVLVE